MTGDSISIDGIRAETHIGWPDEERAEAQVVLIDLVLHCDLSRSGLTDDLADTVDYDTVISEVRELVRSSKSRLLEHLAEEIATLISRNPLVERVTVQIRKEAFPGPGAGVEGVSVGIERTFT
ncbi:MAG TPA: dihydroneopterin aldolase [Actinomycetota bacterium]|nr:dihydroneopterin aldolase [Actinomycetota bacterium]